METSWDQLLFLEGSFVVELVKYGVLRGEFPHHRYPVEGTRRLRKSGCGLSSRNSQPWEGGRWWGGDPACVMRADPSRRAAGSCLHLSSPPWMRTQPHPSSWHCPPAPRSWGLRNKGLGGGSYTHIFTMLARGVGTIPVGTNWPSLGLVFLRISLSLGWEENVKWEVW